MHNVKVQHLGVPALINKGPRFAVDMTFTLDTHTFLLKYSQFEPQLDSPQPVIRNL